MVTLAEKLQGWTKSVYKFGCGFVHLSDFHNHLALSPFDKLKYSEKLDITSYLRRYHDGRMKDNPDILELSLYIPQVFEKITKKLEQDETLDELNAQPGA